MTVPSGARRNLRLYPWYVAGGSFFAWIPVFFLYFSTHVTLTEVLALEAIYYASVVLLEVPSGYFSDRVGRSPTLIISAAGLVAAYATFGLASSFVALACAQVLLAAGLAFNSGTDTSFHLATLEELGEADRYADREAKLVSLTFAVGGAAAVAGGAIALIDIRFAYGLSLLGAAVALVAALAFAPVARASDEASASLVDSLRGCVDLAMTPRLGWFFAAAVVATVINHIPYEFYQPYLERLEDTPWDAGTTPLVAGLHLALFRSSRPSPLRGARRWRRGWGRSCWSSPRPCFSWPSSSAWLGGSLHGLRCSWWGARCREPFKMPRSGLSSLPTSLPIFEPPTSRCRASWVVSDSRSCSSHSPWAPTTSPEPFSSQP